MRDKNQLQGILGTILLHAVVLLILWLVYLRREAPQEESGVPVMLGSVDLSQGDADPYDYTPVEVETPPPPAESAPEVPSTPSPADPLITQTEEPSLVVKESKAKKKETVQKKEAVKETVTKKETKKETPKETVKPAEKTTPKTTQTTTTETKKVEASVQTKEKSEAEKRAEAEAAAAAAVSQKMAGAFGKGSSLGSSRGTGTTGSGMQGSPTGNGNVGKSSGVGGLGNFDLNGRSLRDGALPTPAYKGQEEGRVVVTITVNPEGNVIGTSINKRTDTMSATLRHAAEEAAKKAKFNRVEGANNQTGTITYYFKLN
jgi:TonB family protein